MTNFTAMLVSMDANILRAKTVTKFERLVEWLESVGALVDGALTPRDLELVLNEQVGPDRRWVVREW